MEVCNDDFEVVIARYNEDSQKLNKLIESEFPHEKVTVYNKGIDDLVLPANAIIKKLPNIGREAHTYLHHVIENYESLANRILFMQAYVDDHSPYRPLISYKNLQSSQCQNIIANCHKDHVLVINYHLSNANWENTKWSECRKSTHDFVTFANQFLNKTFTNKAWVSWSHGAIFSVNKQNILCHHKSFHQKIYDLLDHVSPVEGHFLERLWDEWANCN